MGFMDGFKRFMQGKPVFEVQKEPLAPNQSPTESSVTQPVVQPTPASTEPPKIAPLVYVERLDSGSNPSSPHLECELHIRNHSSVPVRLERLDLLGQNFALNKTYLQPGQEWEYQVPTTRPTTTNFHEAKLYYETEDGKDFCSAHTIEYQQLPDRTYNIVRLHFIPPVRDL